MEYLEKTSAGVSNAVEPTYTFFKYAEPRTLQGGISVEARTQPKESTYTSPAVSPEAYCIKPRQVLCEVSVGE